MNLKICTFFLLFFCSVTPALSDKCPDRDTLPTTCTCSDESTHDYLDIQLSCSDSTLGELERTLSLMGKSSRLGIQLHFMKLGNLPSKIFNGLNVVKLDIWNCELNGLAPPGEIALQGLEETLLVLVIASSFTKTENPTVLHSLSHLSRLRELELSYNAITEVHDEWFSSPPPALSHLIMSNNGIEKLGDRAFEKLINLEYLGLFGNRFDSIKRSMLPKQGDRLEYLKLENNAFTSVPDDLFTNMPALKVLSIRINKIARLQEQAFKPIWSQLDVFDARGNPLVCDSTMEWLFHVKTEAAVVLGTCEGPLGREGMELHDFIESKGQLI